MGEKATATVRVDEREILSKMRVSIPLADLLELNKKLQKAEGLASGAHDGLRKLVEQPRDENMNLRINFVTAINIQAAFKIIGMNVLEVESRLAELAADYLSRKTRQ